MHQNLITYCSEEFKIGCTFFYLQLALSSKRLLMNVRFLHEKGFIIWYYYFQHLHGSITVEYLLPRLGSAYLSLSRACSPVDNIRGINSASIRTIPPGTRNPSDLYLLTCINLSYLNSYGVHPSLVLLTRITFFAHNTGGRGAEGTHLSSVSVKPHKHHQSYNVHYAYKIAYTYAQV